MNASACIIAVLPADYRDRMPWDTEEELWERAKSLFGHEVNNHITQHPVLPEHEPVMWVMPLYSSDNSVPVAQQTVLVNADLPEFVLQHTRYFFTKMFEDEDMANSLHIIGGWRIKE